MSVKSVLQSWARSFGLYERLKESRLYDLYWVVANQNLIRDREAELSFYRSLLSDVPGDNLIFDIGAHQGTKTAIFVKLGARVVAVEPDSLNEQSLRRRFLRWRLRPLPVTIVGKALSDTAGIDSMWVDTPGSAKNTLSSKWVSTLRNDEQRFGTRLEFGKQVEVETSTLNQMIEDNGVPRFIKIDVEGFETHVLAGLSRPVPCLSFEVNLPEFRTDGATCVHILDRLDTHGRFNYLSDCRQGFLSREWMSANVFLDLLGACSEHSIEVFWRSMRVVKRGDCSQSLTG